MVNIAGRSSKSVSTTVLLTLMLMAIIVMMILPVPAWILDIGLAGSFALAILIFSIAIFIERPLDFSSFPTVLLASLMLRLSLNISSTKLIIGEGHTGPHAAGDVIHGFAQFIMGGSVFLGLVVFCVLLIVNFMVITKGAARMAEVGARFALDGMPGKQLAIDSDMSSGAIDHAQAKARRETEQQETTFFGSLDGASKFVKGDAVAGLIITLLNLVVGLIMGLVVHDMSIGSAIETYAVLTVGDGLVSQIPAVIISIAAALLLAKGGTQGAADMALLDQLGRYPEALGTVAFLMVLFALVPGLPFVPFIAGGIILGIAARAGYMRLRRREGAEEEGQSEPEASKHKRMGDVLDLDDVHVEFSTDLVNMALDPGTGLDARIVNMRDHIARSYGLLLSEIRLTDRGTLPPGTYVIRIHGVEQVTGVVHPDLVLALKADDTIELPAGTDVVEPVYGAPARWIQPKDREDAALAGVTIVAPAEILATHLLETIKDNLSRLLTLKTLRRIMHELVQVTDPARAEANRRFLDEMLPDRVPMDVLHGVLRLLLDEQVSIRNLPLIIEAIGEARLVTTQVDSIAELVRQRIGFQLVADLRREDGSIPLVQLAPEWEDTFASYQIETDRGGLDVALPPDEFNKLSEAMATRLSEIGDRGITAALVTTMRRRRFLRTVLRSRGLNNTVLSFEEIGLEAKPALVGVIAA